MAGHDTFTFASAPTNGMNSTPVTNATPSSSAEFANIHAALTATHDDAFGNAAVPDAVHLWAHHSSGFHFI